MSLQRYLILLIFVLILAFSSFQFYFIEQVKNQVNNEIVNKSRTLSQVALSALVKHRDYGLSVNNLNNIGPLKQPAINAIKITPTPNREIVLSKDLTLITGPNTKTIFINYALDKSSPNIDNAKTLLSDTPNIEALESGKDISVSKIDALVLNEMNGSYRLDFAFNDSTENFQKFVKFDTSESTIDKYFVRLKWQLISFTIIGLLVAFWLANQVSKPLERLMQGFAKLKQGEFGVQLPKTGIKEMRETISAFNTTSKNLQELQSLEKKFQQQQQMAELGEVARGLAHTLRNPLNTIGLSVSRLLDNDLTSSQKEALANKIQYKITHLDDTIKNLMHLATSDLNRSEQIDVSSVVSDVLLEMTITSTIPIIFSPHQNSMLLRSSEAEVRAMFHALISNAIEASKINESKGSNASITVSLQAQESGILLKVCDKGEGIQEQDFPHIFTPHFTTKPEGAGMGLFIVKRISELYYNGILSLKNNIGGGCCASLILHDANDSVKDLSLNKLSSDKKDNNAYE